METALLLVCVLAALVALTVYVRRAYQGYLYAGAAGHGPQFDPTQTSSDTLRLNRLSVVQNTTVTATQPALALPEGECESPAVGGCLPDAAGARIGGRILRTKTNVHTEWDLGRDATFTAQ